MQDHTSCGEVVLLGVGNPLLLAAGGCWLGAIE